jgi:UDP-GlcNAc:undecaprenyl-phosphate/decaprenyl-phosphate GlcNAc-1-phosphate transferase
VREYLLTLLVAAAVTFLTTGVIRRLAVTGGVMTPVRDRDVHAIPTPRLGGVAMLIGLAAALVVASELPFLSRELYANSRDPWALLAGGGLICLLGAIDDKWGLDALTKLAGQVLAAAVMVVIGIQMTYLPIPGTTVVLDATSGVILSVLIVVATVNAVNFVDGLDGLLAGIATIAALAFYAYTYLLAIELGYNVAISPALFSIALAGVCLGFLPHNFYPARIFMGDSGSMLIGLVLAASTVSFAGQIDFGAVDTGDLSPALLPLLLPFAAIAAPFLDLVLAVIRRIGSGRSPFAPDKQHLHHRLLEIGHSHRRAVLIMYFWSALIAFGVVGLSLLGAQVWALVALALLVVVGVGLLNLPRLSRRFGPPATAPAQRTVQGSVQSAAQTDAQGSVQAAVQDPAGPAEQPPSGQPPTPAP